MRQVALSCILGSLGLSASLVSGCGGSTFSASNGSSGEANGGSGASGMTDIGGMTDTGGMTDAGGMTDTGGTTSSGGKNSGGASSAGGKFGRGGASSVGGNTGAAGSGGSAGGKACATGTVTFQMVPAKSSNAAAYCSGCSANWLTVTDSNGQVVAIDRSCSVADCDACMPTTCPPVACLNQSVPAEGLTRSWDETQWVDNSCGASMRACAGAHCVAPGKYKAKMCALKNTTPTGNYCVPGDSPVCTEVDFVLPGATTVQGVIGG
jgi:hypothetical protein